MKKTGALVGVCPTLPTPIQLDSALDATVHGLDAILIVDAKLEHIAVLEHERSALKTGARKPCACLSQYAYILAHRTALIKFRKVPLELFVSRIMSLPSASTQISACVRETTFDLYVTASFASSLRSLYRPTRSGVPSVMVRWIGSKVREREVVSRCGVRRSEAVTGLLVDVEARGPVSSGLLASSMGVEGSELLDRPPRKPPR